MRVYTCTFENATIANASGDHDLFELTPADDKPILILGLKLSNVGGTADAGDAQEELLRLAIIRGHTSSGNGTSVTPRPVLTNSAAAGFTAEYIATTIASAGTTHTLVADGWNVRIPYETWFPMECAPGATQADTTIVVRMLSTVADDITASGTIWVAELV